MDATQELEMMKDGARRMQDFLKKNGLDVKHSVMLEAISAGFGSRNWRTVREKLNAPLGAKSITLEDLGGLRWAVHGVYCDNDQRYVGYYKGATALEAQIIAQVERLVADDGARIDVSCVIDRLTGDGADAESYVWEASIVNVATMLRCLAGAARRQMPEPPQRGVSEAEAWDSDNLAIELFEQLLGAEGGNLSFDQKFLQDELNEFWYEDLPDTGRNRFFAYQDLRGEEHVDINPTGELQEMLNIALRAGLENLSDNERICVYQASAIIELAYERFDHVFANCIDQP